MSHWKWIGFRPVQSIILGACVSLYLAFVFARKDSKGMGLQGGKCELVLALTPNSEVVLCEIHIDL